MCGIAGIFGESDEGLAREFCRILEHRGPDDQGFHAAPGGPVTLAATRLAIIDLTPAGHQPMFTADGRYALIYNGELYNFAEIRGELAARGRHFRSRCDTEVVLEAFADRGPAALDGFNGMFALALWDAGRRSGLLARDPFGVKPLYYAPLSGGRLIFASEIKALLLHPDLSPSIDAAALEDFLAFLWTPDPHTMFEGVYRLPPGHVLEWRAGSCAVRRYYQLPQHGTETISDADASRELHLQLRRAVARQQVSDVPVGLFLSGGLDSSALLAEAAGDGGKLRCYTASFPAQDNAYDQFTDDLPYARAVARHFGVPLTEFEIRAEVADLLPRLLYFLDEPLADPAIVNTYLIARQARQDGAIVLLSGQGADELLGGYRRHLAPLLNQRVGWLPAGLRRALAAASRALPSGVPGSLGGVLRRARKLLAPLGQEPLEQFIAYCQWLSDDDARSLLAPDAVAGIRRGRPSESTREILQNAPADDLLGRMLYRDLTTFLPSLNLAYTDKMGMAASVEARVPYLDRELAEFAWRLPARHKIRGRSGKWILRQAMRGVLPAPVLSRPKTGFGAPVRHWMRHQLREMVSDLLSPSAVKASGFLSPDGVERLRTRFDAGQADVGYSLWALLVFQLWRETFTRHPALPAKSL